MNISGLLLKQMAVKVGEFDLSGNWSHSMVNREGQEKLESIFVIYFVFLIRNCLQRTCKEPTKNCLNM